MGQFTLSVSFGAGRATKIDNVSEYIFIIISHMVENIQIFSFMLHKSHLARSQSVVL